MKPMSRLKLLITAAALGSFTGFTVAQDKPAANPDAASPAAKSPSPAAAPAKPAESQDSPTPPATAAVAAKTTRQFEDWEMQVGERVWLRVKEMTRLHDSILQRVPMPAEEKKMFDDKLADIKKRLIADPQLSVRTPRTLPEWSPEERAALEAKLAEANTKGDTVAAASIQAEINKGTYGNNENLFSPHHDLIDEFRQLSKPERRDAVNAAIDRWKELEVGSPFDGPVRMLWRATKDPDLKLAPETKAAIDAAIKDAMKELPADKRTDARRHAAAEQARAEIFKLLTEPQRKIVEAHIAAFEGQYAELRDYKVYYQRHGQIGRTAKSPLGSGAAGKP